MNETAKTSIFVTIAAVMALAAWIWRPALSGGTTDSEKTVLVDAFPVENVTTIDIVEFDEATSTPQTFQVAQVPIKHGKKVRWSIPSHDNYPADAKEHLATAATALTNLKVEQAMKDEGPGSHAGYGVVDPSTAKMGDTGVGKLVTLRDKAGKELVSLIFGKPVAGSEGLCYARRKGQDQVCVVSAAADQLSSKFPDWIEKDLLKMNTFDLKQVFVRDYKIVDDPSQKGQMVHLNGRMTLGYDDAGDPQWRLLSDERFAPKDGKPGWAPGKLGADEELNATRLSDMKQALEDLKIVDVQPKPPGLSADLKASKEFINNQAAEESLGLRGFLVGNIEGPYELYSSAGDMRFQMKDGVEYVLRFGGTTLDGAPAKKDAKKGKVKPSGGLNRYLFVSVDFNSDAIAKPALEPLPEEPKPEKPVADKAPAKTDAAKPADAKAAAKDAKSDAKGSKDAKTPVKASPAKGADAKKNPPKPPAIDIKAERQRISKENQRKQEEYDAAVKKGRKHVDELNARFADWYYVISDDVYQKVRLSRDLIVKKKDKKDAKGGEDHDHAGHDHGPLGDLEKLQHEGLKGPN